MLGFLEKYEEIKTFYDYGKYTILLPVFLFIFLYLPTSFLY